MPGCGLVVGLVGDLDGLVISVIAAHERGHRRNLGRDTHAHALFLGSELSLSDLQSHVSASVSLKLRRMPSQSLCTVVAGVNSRISAHTPQADPHELPCRLTLIEGQESRKLPLARSPGRANQRDSEMPSMPFLHTILAVLASRDLG